MHEQDRSRPAAAKLLSPFKISLQSSEHAVRGALSEFLGELEPLKLDIEESGTVELVLAEVLNNIVEHAYPDGKGEGAIVIRCMHARDGLHIRITDKGAGMPDGQLPLGQPVAVDVDFSDLPEGGFGWFLIQDLAKDVTYKRIGDENHLVMRLPVGIPI